MVKEVEGMGTEGFDAVFGAVLNFSMSSLTRLPWPSAYASLKWGGWPTPGDSKIQQDVDTWHLQMLPGCGQAYQVEVSVWKPA